MSRLPIQTGTEDKILRTQSKEIKKVDKAILQLIDDMHDTLEAEHGLGVAAPQVGFNIRLALARLNHGTPHEVVITMINPEITFLSPEFAEMEEGCLSIPGVFGPCRRSNEVVVRFFDVKGKKQTLRLTDLNARIIQHEVDHLNGMLYVDRLRK